MVAGAAAVVGALSLSVLLAACSAPAGAPKLTATQKMLDSAFNNAVAARWVHEDVVATGSGHTLSMVSDIGVKAGRQVITFDAAHAEVAVVDGTAYIEGDATALTQYFGIPTKTPQKYADKWISVPSSNSAYEAVASTATIGADFGQLVFAGPFHTGAVTVVGGQQVLPISGHTTGSSSSASVPATLDLTTTGKLLPVQFSAADKHASEQTTWSDWGQAVTITAPHGAIPIATVLK